MHMAGCVTNRWDMKIYKRLNTRHSGVAISRSLFYVVACLTLFNLRQYGFPEDRRKTQTQLFNTFTLRRGSWPVHDIECWNYVTLYFHYSKESKHLCFVHFIPCLFPLLQQHSQVSCEVPFSFRTAWPLPCDTPAAPLVVYQQNCSPSFAFERDVAPGLPCKVALGQPRLTFACPLQRRVRWQNMLDF